MSDADDAVRAIRARALARASRGEPASSVSRPGMKPLVRTTPAEQARAAVLEAAVTLLTRDGFAKVTLDAVAQQAGVSRGKLMEICFSREELFYQVLVAEVEQVTREIKGLLAPDIPAMELMRASSEQAFGFVSAHPLLLQLMLGEAADAMPDWADRLNDLRLRLLEVPKRLVQIGIDQELLRDDVPAELVASLLFEIHVAGHLLHHPGPDAKLRAAQRRAAVLEVLFNGLRRRG